MPSLEIQTDVSLQPHTTLRVPALARWFADIESISDLRAAFQQAPGSQPVLVLGGGSNCLFKEDYDGLVARITMRGVDVLEEHEGADLLRVSAGENWHSFLRWALDQGYCGIENLALIPGTVGAAPIQNIGAYGMEVEDVIESVEVFDVEDGTTRMLDHADCEFAYRDSVFKREPGHFVVTAVHFRLPKTPDLKLDYSGLRERLEENGITEPRPVDVADAVESLRREKLPDPSKLGNAGSFFKNPIVSGEKFAELEEQQPDIPHFEVASGIKLSAGWLIEQAGMMGFREGDAGISERHALVLVNHGAATGEQLWDVAATVREKVAREFGITLEPEPRVY